MREARRVSRREGERDVPRDERERRETWFHERERDARERRRERERVERERMLVRLARACPNIVDTHEAKRVRPDASNERGQTPREGEERE